MLLCSVAVFEEHKRCLMRPDGDDEPALHPGDAEPALIADIRECVSTAGPHSDEDDSCV